MKRRTHRTHFQTDRLLKPSMGPFLWLGVLVLTALVLPSAMAHAHAQGKPFGGLGVTEEVRLPDDWGCRWRQDYGPCCRDDQGGLCNPRDERRGHCSTRWRPCRPCGFGPM